MEVAKPCVFPANARVTEFVTAFNQGLQAVMLEEKDPKPKLKEMGDSIQAVLDKPLL